jgi:hypothetical protein
VKNGGIRRDWTVSGYLALAVGAMAIMGFGIAGAFALGTTLAGPVAKGLSGARLGAEKISPEMSKLLHVTSIPSAPAHRTSGSVISTTSTNWGGYADTATSGSILEATADWFVPSIGCSVYPAVQDNWVGIDGFGSGTVEQGGTYAYCDSSGNGPFYWTWFEFYPYESIQSVSSAVSPGDLIQAYILYNPYISVNGDIGLYTIIVEDISNPAATFTVQGNPSTCNTNGCENGPDSSAECISESLTFPGSRWSPREGHGYVVNTR